MKIKVFLFLFLFALTLFSQLITPITKLNDLITETSGLVKINNHIITFNDSGGEPELYEIDSTTGNILRTVVISNATNVDWEDICTDSTYIYIADIGNNSGDRTDLKIYKLPIEEYLNNDTVTAEEINFSYADQNDFTSSPYNTNYDAEAIISMNDSLYIFTKNWLNKWTNIYPLSKIPGTYQISKTDSINVQCLVSGGTYNKLSQKIVLTAYTYTTPYIIEISEFENKKFSEGTINKFSIQIPDTFSMQIESITPDGQNSYYITSEGNDNAYAGLFKLYIQEGNTSFFQNSPYNKKVSVYPNPSNNKVYVKCKEFGSIEVYNLKGQIIYKTSKPAITIKQKGVFLIMVKNINNNICAEKKIIIN